MRARRALPVFLSLATAWLGTRLPAQNLITNGDFESGNTAGWTFSGFTVKPMVMKFDVSGAGASLNFSNRPGSKPRTLPPGGSYRMDQTVLLLWGAEHLLTADIAVANTLPLTNADAGTIEFWAAGVLLKRVKFGGIFPKQVYRRQVCIRFRPASSGRKLFRVVFSRAWGANLGTPRHHIDNISLLRAPLWPLVCPRGERKIGGSLTLDIYGTARSPFVVYVAASRAKPLKIPGYLGAWSLPLPPASVPVFSGLFDTQGSKRILLPLPSAAFGFLAGVPLFWQGIDPGATPPTLGTPAAFGLYR